MACSRPTPSYRVGPSYCELPFIGKMQKLTSFKFLGAKSKEFIKILAPNMFSFVSEHFHFLRDDPNFHNKLLWLILPLNPDFESKFNRSWRNHQIWKAWLLKKAFCFPMLKFIIFFSFPSSSRPTLVTHSLTYLLTVTLIVLDSKPSGLSDQTETLQN